MPRWLLTPEREKGGPHIATPTGTREAVKLAGSRYILPLVQFSTRINACIISAIALWRKHNLITLV